MRGIREGCDQDSNHRSDNDYTLLHLLLIGTTMAAVAVAMAVEIAALLHRRLLSNERHCRVRAYRSVRFDSGRGCDAYKESQ